jgi:hypothetical protein
LRSIRNYIKGRLNGIVKEFHPNGNIKLEQFYIDNIISSIKEYNEEGLIVANISDSWGTYRHPDHVGAVPLTKSKFPPQYMPAVKKAIADIESHGWKAGKFYARIEPLNGNTQIKIDLWHYNTFLDVNKNEVGNITGENHTLIYDLKQERILERQIWQ